MWLMLPDTMTQIITETLILNVIQTKIPQTINFPQSILYIIICDFLVSQYSLWCPDFGVTQHLVYTVNCLCIY